ncbi:MAG: cytochrome c [Deltaproteobacteria bacterium]|nr:cytochrome c [Deltaproteobacteria bacterium]
MKPLFAKRNRVVAVILVLGCVVLTGALARDSVVLRRKLMESNNSVVAEALNKAVKEKNFAEIEGKCDVILENMDKVLDLFPAGSLSENSRAKPEIWERWKEFSKHPANVRKAAQELAAAARTGDEEAVKVRFKALGRACKSCHESFRAPKPKQGT